MWKNKNVYIIGGGPSLKKLDLSLIHNKRCIGVNNAYRLGHWVDMCWFGDSRWLEWHNTHRELMDKWKTYPGIKASCVARVKDHPAIHYVELSSQQMGIETNPSKVSWNKTSGTSAINIAYHLGAKKIVLLGFDMRIVDKEENWHDEHLKHGDSPDPYPRFLKTWRGLSTDIRKHNIDLVNCCMDSAIPEEYCKREEYLDVLKGDTDGEEERTLNSNTRCGFENSGVGEGDTRSNKQTITT